MFSCVIALAGIDLQAALEDRQRVARAAGARVGNAERVQRVECRIRGGRSLEQVERLGGAAHIGEIRAELHFRPGSRLDPVSGAQHVDGELPQHDRRAARRAFRRAGELLDRTSREQFRAGRGARPFLITTINAEPR